MNVDVYYKVHEYMLKVIPEFYLKHGELGVHKFKDHRFKIDGIDMSIIVDEMNDTQFFCIKMYKDDFTWFSKLMSVAHHIKVQDNIGGLTGNEKDIIPILLDCSNWERIYRFNNKVLLNSEITEVREITKDVLFNLSTCLDDKTLNAYNFISSVKTPFNYIYINCKSETEWYRV